MRHALTDEQWAALGPLVARAKTPRGGQPARLPDRRFFDALLHLARTGGPLRDLPAEFGAWDAVYNRFRRWVRSGAMQRLFDLLTAEPALGEVRRVLVDSTTVRAHRHAAGAGRRQTRSGPPGRPGGRRSAAAAAG
jgi:putative transposase